MGEVAAGGRTVLFVSHNMAAVSHLCERAICLSQGKVVDYGPTNFVIERYIQYIHANANQSDESIRSNYLETITLLHSNGQPVQRVLIGEPVSFRLQLRNTKHLIDPVVSIFICDYWGTRLIMLGTHVQGNLCVPRADKVTLLVETEPLNLLPGRYIVEVGIGAGNQVVEYLHNVVQFDIEFADVFGTGKLPNPRQGIIAQRARWSVSDVQ
jgi:lipopolysaccharide transport system ATP-binding protein